MDINDIQLEIDEAQKIPLS